MSTPRRHDIAVPGSGCLEPVSSRPQRRGSKSDDIDPADAGVDAVLNATESVESPFDALER